MRSSNLCSLFYRQVGRENFTKNQLVESTPRSPYIKVKPSITPRVHNDIVTSTVVLTEAFQLVFSIKLFYFLFDEWDLILRHFRSVIRCCFCSVLFCFVLRELYCTKSPALPPALCSSLRVAKCFEKAHVYILQVFPLSRRHDLCST